MNSKRIQLSCNQEQAQTAALPTDQLHVTHRMHQLLQLLQRRSWRSAQGTPMLHHLLPRERALQARQQPHLLGMEELATLHW
jgi:hypothetical protein